MRVPPVVAAAATAALQLLNSRVEGSSAYDTNKGVFSPQGRLVQLDYVEGIVKRGNLCMGVECKDGVVLMTNKLVTADAAKLLIDGGVRRIYRVDSHVGLLPAGLPADGRALAHKAMEYCRFHRREFGEPIPGRLLAERLGEFLHAGIVRWGSRAYPNALFIACWEGPQGGAVEGKEGEGEGEGEMDGDGDAGFQLYVVDPRGASGRHRAACTGRESSRARKWLHRRAAADASTAAAAAAGTAIATAEQGGSGKGGGGGAAAEHQGKQASLSLAVEDRDREEEEEGSEESEDGGGEVHGNDGSGDDDDEDEDGRASTRKAPLKRSNGGHRRRRGRGERRRLSLSQMTCAEAARALIREARRVRAGEPGKAGAGGGGVDGRRGVVASLPEVAWLTIARKTQRGREEDGEGGEGGEGEAELLFVHHRSMEELFGSEQGG